MAAFEFKMDEWNVQFDGGAGKSESEKMFFYSWRVLEGRRDGM